MQTKPSVDLARVSLQLLALGALIASSFWIVSPFLMAFIWATMIVVATWPLLLALQARLGGRRGLAVAVMTASLLLVLVIPLYFGIDAIVDNTKGLVEWSKSIETIAVPQPPAWVASLPLVGATVAEQWQQIADAGLSGDVTAHIAPFARNLVLWFVGQVGGIGLLLVQFLLTVVIAAILYANGETAAHAANLFARRLAGAQGESMVHLAGQAVRGVALGVVVTAIVQSALAGIGIAIAGVPFASVLTAVMFISCIAQIGPSVVLIPAVIWVYWSSGGVWGSVFLAWAVFCAVIDNVLRPVLIKRGADLPLLLILTGVIGGLIAFGIIGLFIGPVVLAVAYTLLVDWVVEGESREATRATATRTHSR